MKEDNENMVKTLKLITKIGKEPIFACRQNHCLFGAARTLVDNFRRINRHWFLRKHYGCRQFCVGHFCESILAVAFVGRIPY